MIDSLGEVGEALSDGMPESHAELCVATGLQICYETSTTEVSIRVNSVRARGPVVHGNHTLHPEDRRVTESAGPLVTNVATFVGQRDAVG